VVCTDEGDFAEIALALAAISPEQTIRDFNFILKRLVFDYVLEYDIMLCISQSYKFFCDIAVSWWQKITKRP
jgi:hypothetical protein